MTRPALIGKFHLHAIGKGFSRLVYRLYVTEDEPTEITVTKATSGRPGFRLTGHRINWRDEELDLLVFENTGQAALEWCWERIERERADREAQHG